MRCTQAIHTIMSLKVWNPDLSNFGEITSGTLTCQFHAEVRKILVNFDPEKPVDPFLGVVFTSKGTPLTPPLGPMRASAQGHPEGRFAEECRETIAIPYYFRNIFQRSRGFYNRFWH